MELWLAPRAGIWCRSLSGWDAFRAALGAGVEPDARVAEPVPALLPAREGRRAPLHVRLAIEAGTQVCRSNDVALADVATVFASAAGDTEITDYMCRTLATPAPMLSPTRFHNSVHNAASGYWSIGAVDRRPANAVAAGVATFGIAVLEACVTALECGGPVLLIAHDVPALGPLQAVCANRQPFAAALVVSATRGQPDWRPLRVDCRAAGAGVPAPAAAWLRQLAAENESARGIAFLEKLAADAPFALALPLGAATSLALEVG